MSKVCRLFVVILVVNVFTAGLLGAQENVQGKIITENGISFIVHQVVSGETLFSISQRYHIETSLILQNNPQLVAGLKAGDKLKIPASPAPPPSEAAKPSFSGSSQPSSFIEHKVLPRETLYSISRQYNIKIDDILAHNPGLTQPKIDQVLSIPQYEQPSQPVAPVQETISTMPANSLVHTVQPGETLYSISRKYATDPDLIVRNNPHVDGILKSGEKLVIPRYEIQKEEQAQEPETKKLKLLTHKVERRETLYSISRMYNITIDDILKYNPGLKQPRRGDELNIPQWVVETAPVVHTGISTAVTVASSEHVVQPGETLFSISQKYGTTPGAISESNPHIGGVIKPGDRLKIAPVTGPKEQITGTPQPEKPEFLLHTVQRRETLYSISRQYNVSVNDINKYNPGLKQLRRGEILRIPKFGTTVTETIPAPEKPEPTFDGHAIHTVEAGETLFSISRLYQVTVAELQSINGNIEAIKPGMELKVPVPRTKKDPIDDAQLTTYPDYPAPGKIPFNCRPDGPMELKGQTIRVALLLPLMAQENRDKNRDMANEGDIAHQNEHLSEDTIEIGREAIRTAIQFHDNSENFIHFYEGSLLALDSLKQMGLNIEMKVFDTQQKASRIRHLIATNQIGQVNLIIGPVYPQEQKEVAEFALRNQIAMVSPLSPSDEITRSNPWYFQINPTREFLAMETANYAVSQYEGSNFVLVRAGTSESNEEAEFSRHLKNALSGRNSDINTVLRSVELKRTGMNGLRNALESGRKNVVFIFSANEADVSVGVSNLYTLSSEFDITLIGHSRFAQYESINQEYYHRVGLEFLSPYHTNYQSPVTRSFIRKFRETFKTEPNQFSFQGYDATFYFSKALANFGNDFRNCLPWLQTQLLQGNYDYRPLFSGGFVNHGYNVITYTPNWKVSSKNISIGSDTHFSK